LIVSERVDSLRKDNFGCIVETDNTVYFESATHQSWLFITKKELKDGKQLSSVYSESRLFGEKVVKWRRGIKEINNAEQMSTL